MCLMNIAVTEETSEKARELSDKGIASSLNPVKSPPVEPTANTEKRNAIIHHPSPAFYWTIVKIQMHRSLPSFSMCCVFFPQENFKAHALFIPDGKSLFFVTNV